MTFYRTPHDKSESSPGSATSTPSCPRGTGNCRAGWIFRQHLPYDSPRALEILPTYLWVFLCLPQRNSTPCTVTNTTDSNQILCSTHPWINGLFVLPEDAHSLCGRWGGGARTRRRFCYPTTLGWQEDPRRHLVWHSRFADEEMGSIQQTLAGQSLCKAVNGAQETPTRMMAEGAGNGPHDSGRAKAQKK